MGHVLYAQCPQLVKEKIWYAHFMMHRYSRCKFGLYCTLATSVCNQVGSGILVALHTNIYIHMQACHPRIIVYPWSFYFINDPHCVLLWCLRALLHQGVFIKSANLNNLIVLNTDEANIQSEYCKKVQMFKWKISNDATKILYITKRLQS